MPSLCDILIYILGQEATFKDKLKFTDERMQKVSKVSESPKKSPKQGPQDAE